MYDRVRGISVETLLNAIPVLCGTFGLHWSQASAAAPVGRLEGNLTRPCFERHFRNSKARSLFSYKNLPNGGNPPIFKAKNPSNNS
jgi:hypothetical protein